MKEKIYCVSGYKPASYAYHTLSRGFICHCRAMKFYSAGVRLLSGKKFYITMKFKKKIICKHVVKTKEYKFPGEDTEQEFPFNIHFHIEYRHNVKKTNELTISLSRKIKGPAGQKVIGKSSISLESFLQSPNIERIELYTKKNEKLADIFLLFIGSITMTKERLIEWAKKSGSKLGGFDVASQEFAAPTQGGEESGKDEESEGEDEDSDESYSPDVRQRSKSGNFQGGRKFSNGANNRPNLNKSMDSDGEIGINSSDSDGSDGGENEEELTGDEKKKDKRSLRGIMSKAARGLMKKKKKKKKRSSSSKLDDGKLKDLRSQLGINNPVDEQFERILGREGKGDGEDRDDYSSEEEEDIDSGGDKSSDSSEEEERDESENEHVSGDNDEVKSPLDKKNGKKKSDDDDDDSDLDEDDRDEDVKGSSSSDSEHEKKGKEEEEGEVSDDDDDRDEDDESSSTSDSSIRKKSEKFSSKAKRIRIAKKIPDQLVVVDAVESRGAELASYLTRRKGPFRDRTLYVNEYEDDPLLLNNAMHQEGGSKNSSPLREVAARMYEVFKSGEVEVSKRIKLAVVGSDRFYSYFLREFLSSSQFSEEFFEKLVFYLIPLVKPGEDEKRKITINEYMASISPYYRRFFMGGDWTNSVRNLGFGGGQELGGKGQGQDKSKKKGATKKNKRKSISSSEKEQKKVALMTLEKGIQHYFKNADESMKIPLSQVILTFSDTLMKKVGQRNLFVPLLSEIVISRRSLDKEESSKKKKIKSTKKQIKAEQKKVKKSVLNVNLDYFQMNNEKKLTLEKKRSTFHELRISKLREGRHPNYLSKKGFKMSIISKTIKPGGKEKKTHIDDIRKIICSMKEKKSVCEVDGFLFDKYVKHIQVDLKHPSEQTLCVALFSDKQKHF